jgi:hypothetical protein
MLVSVAAAIILGFGTTSARAADFLGSPDACAVALKKDIIQVVKSANQQYAYLNVIDQQTFDELKRDAGASASIPLTAGLLGVSANYSEFEQKRAAFFQQVGYNESSAQSESDLRVVTSDAAYRAFTSCMEILAHSQYGFTAYKTAETKDAVVVEYVYHPTPGTTMPLALTGAVINGHVDGVPPGIVFPNGYSVIANGSGTVQIHRDNANDMTITLQGSGYSATVVSRFDARPVPRTGSAQVVLSRLRTTTATSDATPASSGWTRNNNSVGCDGSTCSSDGRWRADRVEIAMDAPPGTKLSNPTVTCESSADPGVCNFRDTDILEIRQNGTRAYASLRAFSRPSRWTLHAVVNRTVSVPYDDAQPAQPFEGGGIVMFIVPKDASGAIVNVSYSGQSLAVQPGRNSVDGTMTFLGTVDSPTATRYLYRVAA